MLDLLKGGPKLCDLHVAWQQQLSIDICWLCPTSAANPLAAAAAVDQQERQYKRDEWIDRQTLDCFMVPTAYYADHIKKHIVCNMQVYQMQVCNYSEYEAQQR